jgi:hypothetical protein
VRSAVDLEIERTFGVSKLGPIVRARDDEQELRAQDLAKELRRGYLAARELLAELEADDPRRRKDPARVALSWLDEFVGMVMVKGTPVAAGLLSHESVSMRFRIRSVPRALHADAFDVARSLRSHKQPTSRDVAIVFLALGGDFAARPLATVASVIETEVARARKWMLRNGRISRA